MKILTEVPVNTVSQLIDELWAFEGDTPLNETVIFQLMEDNGKTVIGVKTEPKTDM